MKRTLALVLFVCISLICLSASGETLTAQKVDLPGFSFTTAEGSYYTKGEEASGLLFQYFPAFAQGDVSSNISSSQDDLIQYNPVTMTKQELEQFGTDLMNATKATMDAYGFTLSDLDYGWEEPIEVDGQKGIPLRYQYKIGIGDTTVNACAISYFFCVGNNRYNITISSDSMANCHRLIDAFFQTLLWK